MRKRTVRRYMCRKDVWDHVENVGNKFRSSGDWPRKNCRVGCTVGSEGRAGSGTPMSSPPEVLGGPVPVKMAVRWDCGIV